MRFPNPLRSCLLRLSAILCFSGIASAAGTYRNPVVPGFFPDPSIVRVGADYYMVNSTFQYFPAIIISHSKDLVHWEQIGHVFSKSEELDLSKFFDGCGIWAPDISYHNGKFYIFFCLVQLTKDRKINVRGNYMVESKNVLGPYSKPVQLTTEGNDPSHFVDDDGTHYMLYAAGIPKGGGTKIVKLSPDCKKVVEGPFWMNWGPERGHPEGPHLFKKGGYYYHHMASGGGYYEGHHQVIARSKSLHGPYEPSPHNPFIAQPDKEAAIQHQGHAKLVETQNGEWWAVYLCQRRINGFSQLGRETGLDKVDWLEDGWPVLNGGKGPTEVRTVPNLPVTVFPQLPREEFDRPSIGLPWQFVRNPDPAAFSLSERAGWLRIRAGANGLDAGGPQALVLQREVSQRYTATTKLEFHPAAGEAAGLLCYYDSKSYIRFGLTGKKDRLRLELAQNRKGKQSLLFEVPDFSSPAVYLRVKVNGLKRQFSYSLDNKTWKDAGPAVDASFLSDEGTPQWGFTGTMVGIFANDGGSGKPLPADFDWFELNNNSRAASKP